ANPSRISEHGGTRWLDHPIPVSPESTVCPKPDVGRVTGPRYRDRPAGVRDLPARRRLVALDLPARDRPVGVLDPRRHGHFTGGEATPARGAQFDPGLAARTADLRLDLECVGDYLDALGQRCVLSVVEW